jgi:hypothetical protein
MEKQAKHRFAPLNAPTPGSMPKRFGCELQQNYHRPHALSSAIFQASPVITPFAIFPKKTPVGSYSFPMMPKRFGIFVDFGLRERTMPFFE